MPAETRVLVLGSSTINKGAEAMLRTVMAELGGRLGPTTFLVGDHRVRQWDVDGVVKAGAVPADIQTPGRLAGALERFRYLQTAPEPKTYWEHLPALFPYAKALAESVDAAVDVSGFLFSDQRGEVGKGMVPVVDAFRRAGKPFVFLPQAWGPFETEGVRRITRRAVEGADLVFARDDTSLRYLESLDVEASIEQAPDMAFLFVPSERGEELVRTLRVDSSRPLAAIAPNIRVYERTPGEGQDNLYAKALVLAAEALVERGAHVILIPHEILASGAEGTDDRYLCEMIARLADSPYVTAALANRSAEDFKAIVGECDLMVGSRFHALVASLSCGVPSVAIGWAHKYPELFGEFGLEGLVIDHDRLTTDELVSVVNDVWSRRGALREQLASALPLVKQRSRAAFDATAELIRERTGRTQ